MTLFYPKPRRKTSRRHHEKQIIARVRAAVVERDQGCRAQHLGGCEGMLQWAHLHEHRRSKTRGLPPEMRHTTAGTLMLCQGHHLDYDEHRLSLEGTTIGADGPLHFYIEMREEKK